MDHIQIGKKKLFKIKSKAGDLVIWIAELGMVQLKIFRKHSLGFNSNIFFLVDQQSMDMTKSLPKKIFNELSIDEKIIQLLCCNT